MDLKSIWNHCLGEAHKVVEDFFSTTLNVDLCEEFSQTLIDTYKKGGTVFACGNGGSHCDAMHFAEEMTGRYRKERRPLAALALGDAAHTTCVANDYGFEHVFSRQLEALGRKGDCLIALSTSGNSPNVINAVDVAKSKGIRTIGLLGKGGGRLKDLVDLPIVVPGETSDRVQEMHIKLIHIVIETVERHLFPENY